ncbi:MAG: hypothetical protein N2486_10600, partial [Caloramator sp.]|nr:hypothetical protein [Caloramator sp.]
TIYGSNLGGSFHPKELIKRLQEYGYISQWFDNYVEDQNNVSYYKFKRESNLGIRVNNYYEANVCNFVTKNSLFTLNSWFTSWVNPNSQIIFFDNNNVLYIPWFNLLTIKNLVYENSYSFSIGDVSTIYFGDLSTKQYGLISSKMDINWIPTAYKGIAQVPKAVINTKAEVKNFNYPLYFGYFSTGEVIDGKILLPIGTNLFIGVDDV